MVTPELTRYIRREIERQLQIILSASCGGTSANGEKEVIDELYPGMPSIPDRPVSHPYGLSSRAPRGTISVVAQQGEHIGNKIIIGHRDKARPPLEEGETILYNSDGDRVYIKHGQIIATTPALLVEAENIKLGSSAANENFVLGQVFKKFAQDVLTEIASHTHMGSLPGFPTGVPMNQTQFQTLKSSPIDDDAILSDKIFGEKG